jgi:hypothetical protein
MSVINLYCDEILWGEIFPGIYLIQGGKEKDFTQNFIANNNIPLKEGRFGLTINNDPFLIFSESPINNPYMDWSESDIDNMHEDQFKDLIRILEVYNKFNSEVNGHVNDMVTLYKACVESGYDKQSNIGEFICNKIQEFINVNKPIEVYNFI